MKIKFSLNLFAARLLCCAALSGAFAIAAEEFEIVGPPAASGSTSRQRSGRNRTAKPRAQRPPRKSRTKRPPASSRQERTVPAPPGESTVEDTQNGGGDFVVVSRKSAAGKADPAPRVSITDDPNFSVVSREDIDRQDGDYRKALREYEEKYRTYEARVKYLESQRPADWRFLFYEYRSGDNTINGADARLFAACFLVSLIACAAMLFVLIREYGRRPPVYSREQMCQLRQTGAAPVSEAEAQCFVTDLWSNITGGRGADDITVSSRGELDIMASETAIVAGTLPTDPDSVDRLNKLSDAVCFWRTRHLIAPGIMTDSGIVKRVFMTVAWLVLICLYLQHPMCLLVILSPLAFMTPAYLISARERSLVYRMLGGSLKIFGRMLGNAAEGAGRMEGATATVYKTSSGKVYIEENYWGVLILFALKIALACFFLWLVYLAAPLIVLYAVVRNYILAI